MLIVAISVLFTNNLARALQLEEQKNMAIWAEATQRLILADENEDIDFVSSVIEQNITIPVYICDAEGNILASRNVEKQIVERSQLIPAEHHGPIELKIDEATTQYIYWDDSGLLVRLRYVPYAQFGGGYHDAHGPAKRREPLVGRFEQRDCSPARHADLFTQRMAVTAGREISGG